MPSKNEDGRAMTPIVTPSEGHEASGENNNLRGRIVPHNTPVPVAPSLGPDASHVFTSPEFFVRFGPVGYVLMWIGIYGLHAVSAAYFITAGIVYKTLPGTLVAGNLKLYSLIIPVTYFSIVSTVHYIMAAAHIHCLVMPLLKWLYRTCTSKAVRKRIMKARRRVTTKVGPHLRPIQSRRRVNNSIKNVAIYVFALTFGRNGFFGVEGNYFETIFLIREVIETLLQSFQAYQMSHLLPRLRLNRFYAILLVINCWTTPVLSHVVKHKPLQRLLCVLSDVILDFISSIGVPFVLGYTYAQMYDPTTTNFPRKFWYSDTEFVTFVNECPIILVNSAIAGLSRLMFSISMMTSLEDVKNLVGHRDKPNHHLRASLRSFEWTTSKSSRASLVTKASVIAMKASAFLSNRAAQREKMIHWGHRIMTVYGVAVLAFHIQAEAKAKTTGCAMELRPWLRSRRACALVEMNCHTNPALTGNLSNFEMTFGDLDPLTLEHIVYRHCPQVEFGPQFTRFTNLIGMKIYNSTVTKWDEDAALTQSTHPNIVFAFYVYTKFPNDTLPNRLLTHDFPKALLDIEFVGTNIAQLPSDLHQRWPKGLNLYLEKGPFTSIPSEIPAIKPSGVTLAGHHITDLTQAMLNMVGTRTVALSGNPITHISESLNASTCVLKKIHLDSTNLSSIPKWMDEAFLTKVKVNAGRTPICRDVLLKVNATATKQLLASRPYLTKVVCTDLGYDRTALYPLAFEIRADEVW